MKAFFIFKDGKLVGSPIGYTTEKGALKSRVGCEDWYKTLRPYDKHIYGLENISKEQSKLGLWKYYSTTDHWLFQREIWSRKIWTPYVKEHYKIIEKEFDIVFKD